MELWIHITNGCQPKMVTTGAPPPLAKPVGVIYWILLRPWIRRFTTINSAWWFEQVAKTVDKILKKFTGTLDHS